MPFTTDDLTDAVDLDGFAVIIQSSRRTAERIVASGEIDFFKPGTGRGRRILIPRRAIDDWLNRRAITTKRTKATS